MNFQSCQCIKTHSKLSKCQYRTVKVTALCNFHDVHRMCACVSMYTVCDIECTASLSSHSTINRAVFN